MQKNTIRPFKKLLVANRSEIAIRIFRAATELRIPTVAIYTYEDRFSLHRIKADEAYQIGADNEPLKPYLDMDEIIRVAKKCGADAIHPGYGFLSENVGFARKCAKEGITFIGPKPSVMEALGDKLKAKEAAQAAGVPMIPGSKDFKTEKQVEKWAEKIGYPVIIKAVAGGGGRGMRVCRSKKELLGNYREAKKEAGTAFGDDTVFLEKFIENPKHVEVQILGDNHGDIVHLYERDCSVQRRFQKVVEIAPSIDLKENTKQRLHNFAKQIAEHVGYNNAGTVEFLVDKNEDVYFIEVNPRIQVEHTVTEEVTGIDIVRAQILIAQGHPLNGDQIRIDGQESIRCDGFALQCRVTTEKPAEDFQPDYGTIIAYRSPAGFGIRLDGGNGFSGAHITPYFDSLLVKVTVWGRTFKGACRRMRRCLLEFRIRGLETNTGFLVNLIENADFQAGKATVNFIGEHPELMQMPTRRDRGTKVLRYLAEVMVNGNPDVPFTEKNRMLRRPNVPDILPNPKGKAELNGCLPGTKQQLEKLGPEGFSKWLKKQRKIHFTDTTFRDAHQSLLATRVRTYDMLHVAEHFAQAHGHQLFSMEVWGGATFDVAMRFLHESPWERLRKLREAIPNTLLQMLFRGTNAVGYQAYPENLVKKFVVLAAKNGIDIFRIFDSLNYLPSMKTSIRTVRKETGSLAEACICYTGDILDPERKKYDLDYYLDLARRLEDEGAHILAIKDMAGLLKPQAADKLVRALKKHIGIPIHLHTHDTAGIQSTTYLKAIEAGVDVIDVALASMSGLTSQPNFNSIAASLEGHKRENPIDLNLLNKFSNYWEAVREMYYPFESELRAGTAEVYRHEIPGGQYTNLKPQARSLGLEEKFDKIKENYRSANFLLGDIVKVTPSSKVVGDLAMFMTANDLTPEDVLERGDSLAFPESLKSLLRGELGKVAGGFPKKMIKVVLKGEKPLRGAANAHLPPIDFVAEFKAFQKKFGKQYEMEDFLSFKLYPKVFPDYVETIRKFGQLSRLPSPLFFYGLTANEEALVEIDEGKTLLVQYLHKRQPDPEGKVAVSFRYNGTVRSILVQDKSVKPSIERHKKAEGENEIGAPLQGNLGSILVKKGDLVKLNQPLFTIEAMKMESTVVSPKSGVVKQLFLKEKTLVEQGDAVVGLE
ncbi:MAG TPA: pyruvate carboxylase [Bacteroidetes bacterium]|nr:pyruvate carboxylase [Bacteroidota bacterium]